MLKQRLAAAAASLVIILSAPFVSASSAIAAPAFNAAVSSDNALAVAAEYDPDGAYILADGMQNGDDISFWLMGSRSNASGLDTAVHEETHSFAWNHGTFGRSGYSEAIYTGSGSYISVPETTVFKTEEWSSAIPSDLRTFRYSTYVSAGASPSANQSGVYGLLNEFNAYSWGMNTTINLLPYYKTSQKTFRNRMAFINSCENNYLAFCEFRYWTLGYLDYAFNSHPDIWMSIMTNQNYINAYCVTERRFENLIAAYKARRGEVGLTIRNGQAYENASGYGYSSGLFSADEAKLLQQINQPALQIQEQYMFQHCTAEVLPAADVNP